MAREALARQLNACLAELARGFLFYLRETAGPRGEMPWGAKLDPEVNDLVEEFLRQDERHVTDLVDAIEDLGEHPGFAPYAMKNFYFNYLDPKYLARTLADHLDEDAKAFEAAARPLERDPTAGSLLRSILADKRKQAARFRELAAGAKQPA